MLWKIRHLTAYAYSAPVFLESQLLRLTPSTDAAQRLLEFNLEITPVPSGRADNVDLDGNAQTRVWFEGSTESLRIEATSTVQTLRANPFDYLWDGPRAMPVRYPEELREALEPYTGDRALGRVGELADAAAVAAGGDAQAFPLELAARIHAACRQIRREEGDPLPGAQTLDAGEGSCRDLAFLFLEAARGKGFAARFVSGYTGSEGGREPELHAWAEVYMPGGGWRGFDPTTGLAVSDRHVVLARAARPSLAAPLSGSFRGSAAAGLTTELSIVPIAP